MLKLDCPQMDIVLKWETERYRVGILSTHHHCVLFFLIQTITEVLLDRFWSEILFSPSWSLSFHMGNIWNTNETVRQRFFADSCIVWPFWILNFKFRKTPKICATIKSLTFESAEMFNIRDFLKKNLRELLF